MAKSRKGPFNGYGGDPRPKVKLVGAQKVALSDGATLLHTLQQQAYIDASARIKLLQLVEQLVPLALMGIRL